MYTDTLAKVIGRDRRRVGVAPVSSLRPESCRQRRWDHRWCHCRIGTEMSSLCEQPPGGTANRPLLAKFKSCKSSQWQSALFIIRWNPLNNLTGLSFLDLVSTYWSVLLLYFWDNKQGRAASQRIICDKLYQSVWLLYFPRISTLDPAYSEPEGNFQPLCDYLENKTAKSRGVLINLSPFHLSRPVIYTGDTFKAWTDLLMYLSFGTVTETVTTFNK